MSRPEGGEKHHRRSEPGANGLGGGNAVHDTSELNIHQHQVRAQLADHSNGLVAAGGVTHRVIAQFKANFGTHFYSRFAECP